MRRRSERKKSTDVASPAPASRRTSRRRKSHSVSEDDKTVEPSSDLKIETPFEENIESSNERGRESSEERSEGKRRRSSRVRTPVREPRPSPAKRRTRRETTPDKKINTIVEEENGTVNSENDTNADEVGNENSAKGNENSKYKKNENETLEEAHQKGNKQEGDESKKDILYNKNNKSPAMEKLDENNDNMNCAGVKIEKDHESHSFTKTEKNEILDKEDQDEVKLYTRDNSPRSRSNSSDRKEKCQFTKTTIVNDDNNEEEPEEGEVIENVSKSDEDKNARTEVRERFLKRHSVEGSVAAKDERKDHLKSEEVNNTQDGKTNVSSNTTAAADTGRNNVIPNTTRKRRWITKKATESKEQILAISTDSLKTLIADVHPVPLSDVQLESSSEVEELASEREEGEQSPSPEPERRRDSTEKLERSSKLLAKSLKENNRHINQVVPGVGAVNASIQHSPSPARNQSSNVLFITNLVRPFTVLQLKGLLARTGKIVENGFWIDRIKSKCYVEYETEDQAIETRHALHGVRWPASNPKCLNVDFGIKKDMVNVIESTKEETPKFGQETNKDNLLVGSGWSRERHEEEKKGSRPVREWDVGKKENLDREKVNRDVDRRRDRSRERSLDRNQDRSRDRNMSRNRENERIDRERDRRQRRERDIRSSSLSPARKQKKKEDPPLRLLDDLFRKTKATPCIYWLPLTPEQIAEKEAFRQKRLEEQKQRLKQRELEREKERERERNRHSDRDRDNRERDHRRSNRSSDRRRSRSRDRRRY